MNASPSSEPVERPDLDLSDIHEILAGDYGIDRERIMDTLDNLLTFWSRDSDGTWKSMGDLARVEALTWRHIQSNTRMAEIFVFEEWIEQGPRNKAIPAGDLAAALDWERR